MVGCPIYVRRQTRITLGILAVVVFSIYYMSNNSFRTIKDQFVSSWIKAISFNDPKHLRHLFPQIWSCPSPNFTGKPGYFGQLHEDEALHKWYFNQTTGNKDPGIFVELGALDGHTFSNTLFFERMFDWRGVLIEAQPANARKLIFEGNRPKTVKLAVGICQLPQTHIRMLGSAGPVAGNTDDMDPNIRKIFHRDNNVTVNVICGPIGTYLRGIGITHIDFFSLDVEGAELSVLLTMDWSIQVHYLLVENNWKTLEITQILQKKGFRVQDFQHCVLRSSHQPCNANTLFINDKYQRPSFSSICIPNI